jgi:hypothetical protein
MSFIDSATELLDRTEASLNSLMADALKAKAYREIAAIAALAEQVSVIGPGRSGRRAGAQPEMAAAAVASQAPAEAAKGAEPFWMRPKA